MISGRDWQRPDLQRKYGSYFSSYLHSSAGSPDCQITGADPPAHAAHREHVRFSMLRLTG